MQSVKADRPGRGAGRTVREAHRRRGTRPPKAGHQWSAEEDALVRALPAAEAARRTGRTLGAVYARRRQVQLPDGRRRLCGPRGAVGKGEGVKGGRPPVLVAHRIGLIICRHGLRPPAP
jgi:hypothetical protein